MNKKANIWRKSRNSGKVLCYIEQGDIDFLMCLGVFISWPYFIFGVVYLEFSDF